MTLLCLVTKLQKFPQTKFYYAFHAKFDEKTALNDEIPVNEWQKKIKHVKLGRNDVYSDYKELLFLARLKWSLNTLHPAH